LYTKIFVVNSVLLLKISEFDSKMHFVYKIISSMNAITENHLIPDELGISRKALHEEVADRLRTMLMQGDLQPGERLNERVLCERLNVSRTPMREAMKVLATEKLIELSPNRGATVVRLSARDVLQLFEVMAALEGLSGELAARHHTMAELAEIKALHFEMLAAHARLDLPNYYRLNRSIHEAINRCAGNDVLIATYSSVNTRIQHLRFKSNFVQSKWDAAVREHEAMLAALTQRDEKTLKSLLEQHLRNKRDAVLENIVEQQTNIAR
jgi:DNA-binding GntR family transcriptional regulator